MKTRPLATWLSAAALFGLGATLLWAQAPGRVSEAQAPARNDRTKLRAEVIRLRTEVEMARFDYELARDELLEKLKIERGLKMATGVLNFGFSLQSAINEEGSKPPGAAPQKEPEQDRQKAADAAKAAELEEKKDAAEEAAIIAERKKELTRLFASLTEKRLDLEDVERSYRETQR